MSRDNDHEKTTVHGKARRAAGQNDLRKKLENDVEEAQKEVDALLQIGEEQAALRARVKKLESDLVHVLSELRNAASNDHLIELRQCADNLFDRIEKIDKHDGRLDTLEGRADSFDGSAYKVEILEGRINKLEGLHDKTEAALMSVNVFSRRLPELEKSAAYWHSSAGEVERLATRVVVFAERLNAFEETLTRINDTGASRLDAAERIVAALAFVLLEHPDLGTRLLFALGEANIEGQARLLVNSLFKTCGKQDDGC